MEKERCIGSSNCRGFTRCNRYGCQWLEGDEVHCAVGPSPKSTLNFCRTCGGNGTIEHIGYERNCPDCQGTGNEIP